MTGLTHPENAVHSAPVVPVHIAQASRDLQRGALSAATWRAYRSDWRAFVAWCDKNEVEPIPSAPEVVAAYVGHQLERGRKAASISRSIAAISCAHETAGLLPPGKTKAVQNALATMRRKIGTAPKQKAPATADRMRDMLALCPDTIKGKRDRAILAFGFAGAFRRSELVALAVDDIQAMEGGAHVTIRKSKTDQEGAGQTIGIPEGDRLKPLAAVRDWLEAAGISEGPVFRRLSKGGKPLGPLSPEAVAVLVKDYARRAGLDPAQFSGHSLRAGFITSGAEAGNDPLRIAEVSRHKSLDVLRGYVRRANLLKSHPGASFL